MSKYILKILKFALARFDENLKIIVIHCSKLRFIKY